MIEGGETQAMSYFPVIDPVATGANITRLRRTRGLSVRDIQSFFGFLEPQAIYKWQRGQSLPSVDNLYALGALFHVTVDEILVPLMPQPHMRLTEQQAETCCSPLFAGLLIVLYTGLEALSLNRWFNDIKKARAAARA